MRIVVDLAARFPWLRAVRYSAVSLVGIVITQALLLVALEVAGFDPALANTAAVTLAAIPVFAMNRAWVWGLTGPASWRREIAPFWAFTLLGLALSTVVVAVAATFTTSGALLSAANIGAFGVLWVAKFAVLDGVVFAAAPAIDGEAVVVAA